MSNPINLTWSLQCPAQAVNQSEGTLQITETTPTKSDQSQSIPTTSTGTAVNIASSVATLGVATFHNRDAVNYVDIGVQASGPTFLPVFRLKPGERYPVRLTPGITLYARANTASVQLDTLVLND